MQDARYEWLQPLSIRDALEREPRDLVVHEGAELLLSPYEQEHSGYFARIAVRTYADTQQLSLTPPGPAEEKVLLVIADDDEQPHNAALIQFDAKPDRGCSCEDGSSHDLRSDGSDLRRLYTSTRKAYHPSLARLLSKHPGTRVNWDSPLAGIVHHWATAGRSRTCPAPCVPAPPTQPMPSPCSPQPSDTSEALD